MFKEVNDLIANNNYKLIADKILTTLKSVQDTPQISSKRWIWELMQNARDVANPKFSHKVSVRIRFYKDKLIFEHNGKCFLIKDILGLLQQVSSKDSRNSEGQTGKFGTGFIGTHLLSTKIDVDGILFDGSKYRKIHVELDRSKNTSEELAKDIAESINTFRNPEEFDKKFKAIPDYKEDESKYETSFTYYFQKDGNFDPDKFQAAKDGIGDLVNTLPTTLITQNDRIKEVKIIKYIDTPNISIKTYTPEVKTKEDNAKISEGIIKIKEEIYQGDSNEVKTNEGDTNILEGLSKNKEENREVHLLSFLEKDEFRLLIPIERKKVLSFDILELIKRKTTEPVLYRNFPLIGSEKFYLPFILDGFKFNPLEPRNGLYLNGNYQDSIENRNIISKAIDSIFIFIDYILNEEKNLKYLISNKFLLASSRIPDSPTKGYDNIATKWTNDLQIKLRRNLIKLPLLKNHLKNNESVNLELLLLPVFEENYDSDFFDIVSSLNISFATIDDKKLKRILPYNNHLNANEGINEYIEWFNIIVKDNLKNDIQAKSIKENKYIKSWWDNRQDGNDLTVAPRKSFIYDEHEFLRDLEECTTLKNICVKIKQNEEGTPKEVSEDDINQVIENLNKLYLFLKKNNRIDYLEKYSIIPNQNFILKSLKDKTKVNKILLYSDSKNKIPKIVRKIYDQLMNDENNKLSNILIEERLNLEEIGVEIPEKNFLQITNEFNQYLNNPNVAYEDKFKFVFNLLSISPQNYNNDEDINIITKMYQITSELKIFDNLDLPEKIEEKEKFDKGVGLWKEAIKFWLIEHPKQIEKYENMENLIKRFKVKKEKKEALMWLNEYYKFLRPLTNEFEKLSIFPCQSEVGEFYALRDLYSDTGFPEEFKDILDNYLGYSLRDQLLPQQITLYRELSHNPMYESKVTDLLEEKFEEMKNISDKEEVVFLVIALKPDYGGKTAEYCEKISFFGKILFDKNFEMKTIKTQKLKYIIFFNYAFEIICEKISSYHNYDAIKSKIENSEIKTKDNFCDFLSQIITCIWDGPKNGIPLNNILNDFGKKEIFLLQNNNFCSIENVKIKLPCDILKDFKEVEDSIIYDLSNNKAINIDYKEQLLDKILNEKLLNYSSNFGNNILQLDEICQKLDNNILEYDYNHTKYENFFKYLVKKLTEHLMEVNGLENLFPFFKERRTSLYIQCIGNDPKYNLLKVIRKYESYKEIFCYDGINDIVNEMKSHGFTDFKQLIEFFKKYGSSTSSGSSGSSGSCSNNIIKVKGNFKFTVNENNSNNLFIKESFNINQLEISNSYAFNYNVEFEIIPKNLNNNQNLEIEIYMKNSNLST